MYIILYLGTLVTSVVLDSVWVFSSNAIYKKALGGLFTLTISYAPEVVLSLLYAFGIVFFVLSPAIQKGSSWLSVLGTGVLFGLIAYAVYDLTNMATIHNWPLSITVIDIASGAVITGITSCIVYVLYTHFK